MTSRTFAATLVAVWALSVAATAHAQELPETTKSDLAAKRAMLRVARNKTVEAGPVRERQIDDDGTVHIRVCGVTTAAHPGVVVCVHREFDGNGVERLRMVTRQDTGAPVGRSFIWRADGTLESEQTRDAEGRLHGDEIVYAENGIAVERRVSWVHGLQQ